MSKCDAEVWINTNALEQADRMAYTFFQSHLRWPTLIMSIVNVTRVRYIPKEVGRSDDIPSSIYLTELHETEEFFKNDWRLPHSAVHRCATSFITRVKKIRNKKFRTVRWSVVQYTWLHSYPHKMRYNVRENINPILNTGQWVIVQLMKM